MMLRRTDCTEDTATEWPKVALRSRRINKIGSAAGKRRSASARPNGTKSDQGGKGGRLVGDVEEWRVRSVDEGEVAGVLPCSEAGWRPAQEHCAADNAEEHGLLEEDHRASWWTRMCGLIATAFRVKITSHRSRWRLGRNSVVGGMQRAAASETGGTRT